MKAQYNQLGQKIKLVIYTQDRREVYWNFNTENKYSTQEIIRRMNRRLLQGRKKMQFSVALYYHNNTEVQRIKGHINDERTY